MIAQNEDHDAFIRSVYIYLPTQVWGQKHKYVFVKDPVNNQGFKCGQTLQLRNRDTVCI